MSRIVIIGASIAGLSAGLLLARDGHEVVVLDRDDITPGTPEEVVSTAHRPGAPHAVQPHAFLALARIVLRDRLPDVLEHLYGQGVVDLPLPPPPSLKGYDVSPDPELVFLMVRRPIAEWALRQAASKQVGLDVRPSQLVDGLTFDASALVPRVTGVRLNSGEELTADLVVDASGRRSKLAQWLPHNGPAPTVRSEECGLVYYGRGFKVRDGVTALPPLNRGFGAGALLPRFGTLLIPSELGHTNVAINALATDSEMKAVRSPDVFTAVLGSVPVVAPWLDVLEPTTDVYPMGGIQSTLVRLVAGTDPIVLGLHVIGDACSTTNPTLGRGLSWALAHASVLAQVVADFPDDLHRQATALDSWVTAELEPFYNEAIVTDAARLTVMNSALTGQPMAPPNGSAPETADARPTFLNVLATSFSDPYVWHRLSRYQSLLAKPTELFDDPEVRARVAANDAAPMPPPVGPTNVELAALLR